jgi:hypothetical protein
MFGIDRGRPRVERLDVGMVLAVAEHARDYLALLGDPRPLSAQSASISIVRVMTLN